MRDDSRVRGIAWVLGIAALTLLLDYATKQWAWNALLGKDAIEVVPGFFHLDFAYNTGSAFGLFAGKTWARPFFITVTFAALAYVLRMAWVFAGSSRAARWGLGMIAGGAIGNLGDRLFRTLELRHYFARGIDFSDMIAHADKVGRALGERAHFVELPRHGVVDFIVVFYWPDQRWPAFNIADSALCVGVALFVLFVRHRSSQPESAENEPAQSAAS